MGSSLRLYLDDLHVADIQDAICISNTWFGFYQSVIEKDATAGLVRRILEFVEFSKDWNRRIKEQPEAPPDASEFDQFNDLIKSSRWSVESGEGKRSKIFEAPLFFGAHELSWRIVD
jgi:hypothetical protein